MNTLWRLIKYAANYVKKKKTSIHISRLRYNIIGRSRFSWFGTFETRTCAVVRICNCNNKSPRSTLSARNTLGLLQSVDDISTDRFRAVVCQKRPIATQITIFNIVTTRRRPYTDLYVAERVFERARETVQCGDTVASPSSSGEKKNYIIY